MHCRYLGQLLGATDEADELLCKGIDILKQDVETMVCACGSVSNTEHLPQQEQWPAPALARINGMNLYRRRETTQGHPKTQQSLRARCLQHYAAWLSFAWAMLMTWQMLLTHAQSCWNRCEHQICAHVSHAGCQISVLPCYADFVNAALV